MILEMLEMTFNSVIDTAGMTLSTAVNTASTTAEMVFEQI